MDFSSAEGPENSVKSFERAMRREISRDWTPRQPENASLFSTAFIGQGRRAAKDRVGVGKRGCWEEGLWLTL